MSATSDHVTDLISAAIDHEIMREILGFILTYRGAHDGRLPSVKEIRDYLKKQNLPH